MGSAAEFDYTPDMAAVFGIGNPLIDVVFSVSEEDLGSLGLDKGIMHLVTEERQTEILAHFRGQEPRYRPGGSAPNTLLALAGLGVTGVICGKIGNDEFGITYDEQVASYGITSRLVRGDGPTGSSIILVTPDGERTMNTHLGMCREFGVDDLDEALLRETVGGDGSDGGGYLYFTGYMWDTETQKGAIRRAISITHEVGGRVVFDLADPFAVERYREDFLELLREDVDVVFANRREAEILYADGDSEPETTVTPYTLVARLAEYVEIVALKTGKDGSLVVHRPEQPGHAGGEPVIEQIPARAVEVRDTTGAGDMYAAGFLAGLARGAAPRRCGEIAGTLAEEIIQHVGAQFDIATIRTLQGSL